ncbi:hypothetical protein KSP39_PZI018789 [Platanthera zijinensis]|uniref:25S rRNA (uridine-N(3))-methyltransferase BMT5-like domain-containing protein n=1 Tax=Platanthera zijinensis TaxID=2320716 RepID=A0AAP0B3I5_9ASPA
MGATIIHEIDARQMRVHPNLRRRKFDRIVYNFPHAGFKGPEDSIKMINATILFLGGNDAPTRRNPSTLWKSSLSRGFIPHIIVLRTFSSQEERTLQPLTTPSPLTELSQPSFSSIIIKTSDNLRVLATSPSKDFHHHPVPFRTPLPACVLSCYPHPTLQKLLCVREASLSHM